MSAASARAARRKAILSKGSDRLAKLTTTARGDDPGYMQDSPTVSSTSRGFLGEHMPAPSSSSFTPSPSVSPQPKPRKVSALSAPNNPLEAAGLGGRGMSPDPSVWSPDQQQQFMRALMGVGASPEGSQSPSQFPLGDLNAPIDPTLPPMDNPLAAMLFPHGLRAGASGNGAPSLGGFGTGPIVKAPSRYQNFMPLVHILALWVLLGYFVFFLEPRICSEQIVDSFPSAGLWGRWGRLINNSPWMVNVPKAFQVQVVPFFWAFMTIEVILHSVQIFTGSNAVKPPTLLAMALPHLPPPFPALIVNSIKYIKMLSMFVDDVAGVIVGIGFIIYFAGLVRN